MRVPDGYQSMLDLTLALPEQLRAGLSAARAIALRPGRPRSLVVCGMGGSGISGSICRSLLWDRAAQPVLSCRDYDLPAAAARGALLVAISYSGETEETLSAVRQARARGCRVVAVSSGGTLASFARDAGWPLITLPGGLPPRAALGYLLGACLGVLEAADMAPRASREVIAAARLLETQAGRLRRSARALASSVIGCFPVIWSSARHLDAVAERWRCQLNENAKLVCHTNELPELDHNEIVGMGGPLEVARSAAVMVLADNETHPRTLARVAETLAIARGSYRCARVLAPPGKGRFERMLWLVMLGDLLSLELARLQGVNPQTIVRIDELKRRLAATGASGRKR